MQLFNFYQIRRIQVLESNNVFVLSLFVVWYFSFISCRQNGALLLAVSLQWISNLAAEAMMFAANAHIAFAGM